MASAIGMISGKGCSSWMQIKEKGKKKKSTVNRVRVCCSYSSSVMDPYKTLQIQPSTSESNVKKAFRQLALQYHPDVCRGNNCGVQFQTINEAYDVYSVSQLRGKTKASEAYEEEIDEAMRGMEDSYYDLWKEFSLGNLQLSKSLQTLSC
ncbi:hypothetical protein V6N11_007050 [Hibiscus sabdariffa]|uniref:J domain-containing protein n=1 Tax=Hibiscus sabdariffa TaxID=183260 RepID=A0ABR2RSI8_9ROSI